MKRILVNDCLTTIPNTYTFWHDLLRWFGCEFIGGSYEELGAKVVAAADNASLIIRNATWFPPIDVTIPTISLLQDIFIDGPQRKMQEQVLDQSTLIVFNSDFTAKQYPSYSGKVIPLPVDFELFLPGNAMGLQQAFSLPENCICWIGASQSAAAHVKGLDLFLSIVRQNPDLSFVAIFKDQQLEYPPPNLRMFVRLPQAELAQVIGACRVGLCTSSMESQHLSGIEMGACGLPMIAPPVGIYWQRENMPGTVISKRSVDIYTAALRSALSNPKEPTQIRDYWRREFDKKKIKYAWTKIIAEIENRHKTI